MPLPPLPMPPPLPTPTRSRPTTSTALWKTPIPSTSKMVSTMEARRDDRPTKNYILVWCNLGKKRFSLFLGWFCWWIMMMDWMVFRWWLNEVTFFWRECLTWVFDVRWLEAFDLTYEWLFSGWLKSDSSQVTKEWLLMWLRGDSTLVTK